MGATYSLICIDPSSGNTLSMLSYFCDSVIFDEEIGECFFGFDPIGSQHIGAFGDCAANGASEKCAEATHRELL